MRLINLRGGRNLRDMITEFDRVNKSFKEASGYSDMKVQNERSERANKMILPQTVFVMRKGTC